MRKVFIILCTLLVSGSVYAMTQEQFNEFEVEGLRMGLSFDEAQKILLENGFTLKPTGFKNKYPYFKHLKHGKIKVTLTYNPQEDEGLFSRLHIHLPNPDLLQTQEKILKLFPNARQDCRNFNNAVNCKFKGQSVENNLSLTISVKEKGVGKGQVYIFERKYNNQRIPRQNLIQMLLSKAASSQQASSSQSKSKSSARAEEESRSQMNPANQSESSSDSMKSDKTGKTNKENKAEKQSQALAERAQKGDAEAQYQMGLRYEQSDGKGSGDNKEAAKWYRKAAEQGHAQAQNKLAKMYDEGNGVSENQKEAVKWLTKAAEQGDVDAAFNLGMHYLQGRGVEQSDEKAFEWFKKAAEKNHIVASYGVAKMYREGLGTKKDINKARKWNETIAGLEKRQSPNRDGIPGEYGETSNDIIKTSSVMVPF